MPDSFFSAPKQKKRKRTDSNAGSDARNGVNKFARKPTTQRDGRKQDLAKPNRALKRKTRKDEELSDQTDDDAGGVDDMDLRADDIDSGASGDEDENETPAEKRLRLAQLYLESVKVGLGNRLILSLFYIRLTCIRSRWRI